MGHLMVAAVVSICDFAIGGGTAGPVTAPPAPDSVVARVLQHDGVSAHRLVRVVDANSFSKPLWQRVKNLVAFRIHRHAPDGTTTPDAPIYLVRSSDLFVKAEAALRTGTTSHEYVWCLLAAVLEHETAHTAPMTERQALTAEAAQLRRCIRAGHLFTANGSSGGTYLGKVEAKLRQGAQEHY